MTTIPLYPSKSKLMLGFKPLKWIKEGLQASKAAKGL